MMNQTDKIDAIIFQLLQEKDLLIIPDFGALICNTTQSKIDEEEGKITPPQKNISFNPDLKKNDAALARSFSESEGITYGAALVDIDTYVRRIRQKLEKEKTFLIPQVGRFEMKGGKLFFNTANHHIQPLEFYGLQPVAYQFKEPVLEKPVLSEQEAPVEKTPLEKAKPAAVKAPKDIQTFKEEQKTKRTQRHKKSKAKAAGKGRYVLYFALAGLILLSQLIIWNVHPKGLELSSLNLLHYNPVESYDIANDRSSINTKPDFEPMAFISIPTVKQTQLRAGYFVVLGAFSKKGNAQKLQNQLKRSGFSSALIQNEAELHRVMVPVGPYQEQAIDNLSFFQRAWNKNAWILENRI